MTKLMNKIELFTYEIQYETGQGVDRIYLRAEDEDHAIEKFHRFYPDMKISLVESRGSVF